MRSGGDLLVDLLVEHGVDTAFGVVSVHNLPLVDAVAHRLRFVPVRHEAAAVNAADGYGRARGPFGVAITSTGTGAGNAAGSLIEALTARGPVLHVTGQIEHAHLGRGRGVIHETQDQLGMLRAVSRWAATVTPGRAEDVLRAAIAAATTGGRGPASVEWPIDLQYHPDPPGSASVVVAGSGAGAPTDAAVAGVAVPAGRGDGRPDLGLGFAPETDQLDQEGLRRAAKLVAEARRPLVWAGGGAVGARPAIARLLDRTGAGLLTSNAGRGVLPEDDPRCVGNFATTRAGSDLLAQADLLVSVGTHFRSNESRDFTLPLPAPHVQIDLDWNALGRNYPVDVGLAGDASTVVDALVGLLPDEPATDPAWPEAVARARATVRDELREAIGAQARLCDDLRAALPREAVLVRDVTIPASTWGNRLLEVYDPATNVYARGGGIGQGLAMALGAACARPDVPVAVLVGDGGLTVHLGELLTVAQEAPWLVAVLFNDGGYGVLRNMQDRYLGRRSGVDLHTPDFAGLCAAAGVPHAAVRDAAAFRPALEAALARRGPTVVEVDVAAIGGMPRPFVPPVHVPDLPDAHDGPETSEEAPR